MLADAGPVRPAAEDRERAQTRPLPRPASQPLPDGWRLDEGAGLLVHRSGELQIEAALICQLSDVELAAAIRDTADVVALLQREQRERALRRLVAERRSGPGPEAA